MTGAVTARMMKERGRSGKTEAEEIEELMSLGINHPARRAHRERETRRVNEMKERMWNDTIFRTRPPNLIGLRCATKEPWHIDEVFYQKKTGNFEAGLTREKYDDRSVLSASKGYTAQITATGLAGAQPSWDSSPMRATPHALKGIKPVTREPWSVDAKINRNMDLEGFDTFSAKVENDSVAGNFFFNQGNR